MSGTSGTAPQLGDPQTGSLDAAGKSAPRHNADYVLLSRLSLSNIVYNMRTGLPLFSKAARILTGSPNPEFRVRVRSDCAWKNHSTGFSRCRPELPTDSTYA